MMGQMLLWNIATFLLDFLSVVPYNEDMMKKHSLILPKCDNKGKRVDVSLALLNKIVRDASNKFGGCSVLEGSGYWVMQTGELKRDEWFRIEILSGLPDADQAIELWSDIIKRDLDQESVLVFTENCEVKFV